MGKLEMLAGFLIEGFKIGGDDVTGKCAKPCGEICGNGNLPFVTGLGDIRGNGDGALPQIQKLPLPSGHAAKFIWANTREVKKGIGLHASASESRTGITLHPTRW